MSRGSARHACIRSAVGGEVLAACSRESLEGRVRGQSPEGVCTTLLSGLPLGIRTRFLPGRLESGKCRSVLLWRSTDRPAPLQPGFRLESHQGQSESPAIFACLRPGKGPQSEQRWEAQAAGVRGARAVGWTRAKAMADPWEEGWSTQAAAKRLEVGIQECCVLGPDRPES